MSTNRRILGFDFGTTSIGTAVGQELTGTATPLTAVAAKNGAPDWNAIEQLVTLWKPDCFVVGAPFNMDDSCGQIALRARKFRRRLHGRFHKPSYDMDERLSTVEAREQLKRAGMKKATKEQIDCMSAAIILETWMRGECQQSNENKN